MLVMSLVLLAAHQEENTTTNEGEADKGANDGTSDPCFALALSSIITIWRGDDRWAGGRGSTGQCRRRETGGHW
jgi:hypothetical protein